MTSNRQSEALRPLGLDFDPFLYAQVGDDQHGGLLSVISALARLGVDPWEQAAALARLPFETAVSALSVLLESLPAGSGKPLDSTRVATRLVALLPHGTALAKPRNFAVPGTSSASANRWLAALPYILVLLLVGAQLLTPS